MEGVQELVKRYRAGEDVRFEIDSLLTAITQTVIKKVCGESKQIFLNEAGEWGDKIPKTDGGEGNESQKMLMTMEPFRFNDYELDAAIDKSLDDALRTYRPERQAKFSTWYYTTLYHDLRNLRRQYEREHDQGVKIDDLDLFYNQVASLAGDVCDPKVLEQFKFITGEDIEKMSDKHQKFVSINITLLEDNKTISNKVVAEVLGVKERTIYNYKKELRQILADSNKRRKAYRGDDLSDDLPDLYNIHNAKDLTPREAAFNIKRDLKYCKDCGEKFNRYKLKTEKVTENPDDPDLRPEFIYRCKQCNNNKV